VRRRRPPALLLGLALATVAALAATACASEADSSRLGVGKDTTTTTAEGGRKPTKDTLDWQSCGLGAECAVLEVPVDYAQPDGDTLPISVARVPASGERTGALFVNPGGPGGTATDFASAMAASLPDDITEHFDIVGVDPRGLGASDIDCKGDITGLYGVDYSLDSPADTKALLDVSRTYVDDCKRNVGGLLTHLGTADVARDIDSVRAAMGDDKLNYLGFSYGTAIGQMLAQMFPDRVRAMVLDGVVELGPTGVQLADDQATGFEKGLQAFAEDCDSKDDCPIGGGDGAVAAVEKLQAQVEKAPIPAQPRDLGPGELSTGLALPLYEESLWPDLARAVDEALKGDGSAMVGLADQYLALADSDIYFAVNCLDFTWPKTPEDLLADGKAAAERSPHFGEPIVNDYVRCSMWPAKPEPLPAVTAPAAPPILVVSTTNDPVTPYEAGVRTAERLKSGVLLTHHGEGHTVVGAGDSCVDDAVARYLVDLKTPEGGTTCD
jgi:pimeloyl-ACP methyl ester carboxylesterase